MDEVEKILNDIITQVEFENFAQNEIDNSTKEKNTICVGCANNCTNCNQHGA